MLLLRVLAEKDPVFFEYGPLLAAYETLVPSVRVYLWVWGGGGLLFYLIDFENLLVMQMYL